MMPIYEFQCKKCNEVSDFNLKMSAPNPAECPHCGGKDLQKLMSSTSFTLKGGGWYSDLYGSSGSGSKPKSSEAPQENKEPTKSVEKPSSPSKSEI